MVSREYSRPISYPDIIYKHLDRMSDSLKRGIEVGTTNTVLLTAYYLYILHFECLLTTCMTNTAHTKRIKEYKDAIPAFGKTWTGHPKDCIAFLEALGKWFQMLIMIADENNMIAAAPQTFESPLEAEEDESGSSNTTDNKG